MDDSPEFLNLKARLGREPMNFRKKLLDLLFRAGDKILPAAAAELGDRKSHFGSSSEF